jgi:hypothetical protein
MAPAPADESTVWHLDNRMILLTYLNWKKLEKWLHLCRRCQKLNAYLVYTYTYVYTCTTYIYNPLLSCYAKSYKFDIVFTICSHALF